MQPRRAPLRFVRLGVCLALCACTTLKGFGTGPLEPRGRRVLVMPSDVEIYELHVNAREMNVAWTRDAKVGLRTSTVAALTERGLEAVPYKSPRDDSASEQKPTAEQLIHLHGSVGEAILKHKYGDVPLPTLRGDVEWSVGEVPARALAESTASDYALFLYLRDEYTTASKYYGNFLYSVISWINLMPVTPRQRAYASLVDLQSGSVVWFKRLAYDRIVTAGRDARGARGLQALVETLLRDLPL